MANLITITDKAKEEIRNIFIKDPTASGKGIRLGVVGGGCSGLSYKLDFDYKRDKDNVIKLEDFEVYIDLKSSIYLKGITLDFKDGLNGKGFIFENPNAKNSCGCGESFAV